MRPPSESKALLAAALLGLWGCAHVTETRSRQVMYSESVRLAEVPQAALDQMAISHTLSGRDLSLRVVREERCVVDLGERQLVRERVVRKPRQSSLAGEAVLLGAGVATAFAAFESSDDSGGSVRPTQVIGVTAVAVALASGVALAVDASQYSDRTTTKVVVTPRKEQRVAACEKRTEGPRQVELVTQSGRRFSSGLDGHGRAKIRLPDDVWPEEGPLDLDVLVDGAPARRLIVTRRP